MSQKLVRKIVVVITATRKLAVCKQLVKHNSYCPGGSMET